MTEDRCTALLLAAGKGLRVGGDIRKQYLEVAGAPLFTYSVRAMQESPLITDIVLLVPDGDEEKCREILAARNLMEKVRRITPGGDERYHTVCLGLEAVDWACDYVFIHDCARPFLDQATICRLYEAVREVGACVAGMPSKDTVKLTDGDGYVAGTPNRGNVWIVQTPQVFAFDLIREAHRRLMSRLDELLEKGISITDDAMVAEQMMHSKIRLVEASYRNIKVTTPEDLVVAEAFLAS